MVAAFVALADDLGGHVVAEGLERAADLAAVRDLGVRAGQGYLLARPSSDPGQVSEWITRGVQLPSPAGPATSPGASPAGPVRLPHAARRKLAGRLR